MKKLVSIFSAFICMLAIAMTLQMQQAEAVVKNVKDGGQTMIQADMEKLDQKLQSINDTFGVKVVVMTMKSLPEGQTLKEYAEDTLKNMLSSDSDNGALLLVQVTDTRKYDILADDKIQQSITKETGIPALKKEVLPFLKEDKYIDAYMAFADRAEYFLAYKKNTGEAYGYSTDGHQSAANTEEEDEFSFLGLLIGLVFSGFIGYCIYVYLVDAMSNVKPETEASAYLDEDSVAITEAQDIFLYTTRSVVHHERDNDDDDDDDDDDGDSY